MKSFTLRTGAWYGDQVRLLDLPEDAEFDVLEPHNGSTLKEDELIEKLHHPFGENLSSLVKGKSRIIMVTDDLGRPTPAHEIIPHVLNILSRCGVQKSSISFLIATGSHRQLSKEELEKKLGTMVVNEYAVESHDAFKSPLKNLGYIYRGFPCVVNQSVAEADLIIGIGCVIPHACHGYGGGAKLFLPGVAGMQSIVTMHGFMAKRGRGKQEMKYRDMRSAAEDFTDKLPPVFLINTIVSTERKICGLFAGSHREVYKEASHFASLVYETPIDKKKLKKYDIVIVNAYPLDADPVQFDKVTWIKKVFKNSFPIFINQAVDNIDYHGWKVLRRHSIWSLIYLLISEIISPVITKTHLLSRLESFTKHPRNYIISRIIKHSKADYNSLSASDNKQSAQREISLCASSPGLSKKPWIYSDNFKPHIFYKKYRNGHLFNNWAEVRKAVENYFPKARIAILPCASIQKPVFTSEKHED